MKFPFCSRLATAAGILIGVAPLVHAEDTTPPIVNKPIESITVPAGANPTTISLRKTFRLTGVTGPTVRFTTNVGDVDVELFAGQTPKTVTTFLGYVNDASTNGAGTFTYNNTLIQRAVPNFVVQGGGFFVDSQDQINQIVNRPAIPSEAGIKNTRGTIAMALSQGPSSGVGDFFFNLVDNAVLDDDSRGGPFTVFGRAIGTLATIDKIAALPNRDFSADLGGSFANVPLAKTSSGASTVHDLVYLNRIAPVPLIAKKTGSPSILGIKVKNGNKAVVTAVVEGRNLVLTPVAGGTGVAKIRVIARNRATGEKAVAVFTYTVQ